VRVELTFTKDEILAVLLEHIKTKGLQPVPGKPLEYKGALQVKLQVEAVPFAPGTPLPSLKLSVPPKREVVPVEDREAVEAGIAQALAESDRLQRERGHKAPNMGPNAYSEWPGSENK
jgi:hypothetical protein